MPSIIGELRGIKDGMDVEWVINDFFKFAEVSEGKYNSPSFDFAGASWCLRIYPNGRTSKDTVGEVEFFLVKNEPDSAIRLTYKLGLKKRDGSMDYECIYTETFEEKGLGYGCANRISKLQLLQRKSDLAPDNVVTIMCRMTRSEINIISRLPRLYQLSDNLRNLMLTGNDSDLTVRIKEKEFKLHKSILRIRSPALATRIIKEMEENMLDVVDIYGYEEDVFKMFLEYVYTGSVKDLSQQNTCKLYEIAEKYEVAELKEDCLKCIKGTLSIDTFFDVIKVAEQYDEKELLSLTSNFCSNNLKDLVQSPQWLLFMQENTEKAYELLSTALINYVKA